MTAALPRVRIRGRHWLRVRFVVVSTLPGEVGWERELVMWPPPWGRAMPVSELIQLGRPR